MFLLIYNLCIESVRRKILLVLLQKQFGFASWWRQQCCQQKKPKTTTMQGSELVVHNRSTSKEQHWEWEEKMAPLGNPNTGVSKPSPTLTITPNLMPSGFQMQAFQRFFKCLKLKNLLWNQGPCVCFRNGFLMLKNLVTFLLLKMKIFMVHISEYQNAYVSDISDCFWANSFLAFSL